MVFLSPNSRHTTVFRPRTNLPFERGVKYSSDDFVSELKKSFVRPTDEDMARSKPPLARQKSAIALEGPRGDFRTNKYAEYAMYAVRLRSAQGSWGVKVLKITFHHIQWHFWVEWT